MEGSCRLQVILLWLAGHAAAKPPGNLWHALFVLSAQEAACQTCHVIRKVQIAIRMQVVIVLFVLLGGYAFFLQSKLTMEVAFL